MKTKKKQDFTTWYFLADNGTVGSVRAANDDVRTITIDDPTVGLRVVKKANFNGPIYYKSRAALIQHHTALLRDKVKREERYLRFHMAAIAESKRDIAKAEKALANFLRRVKRSR